MSEETVYFIENDETHLWWAGHDEKNDCEDWTSDPLKAWAFDDKEIAELRAWTYCLEGYTTVTEHKFVNQIEKEK